MDVKFKIFILLILYFTINEDYGIAVTTSSDLSFDKKLNLALHDFIKNRNVSKILKQNKDLSKSQTNMRKTSDSGKLVDDVVNFIIDFEKNETFGRKKRASTDIKINIDSSYCPFSNLSIICNETYKYHSIDGSCNNLKNPLYGMSNTPYKRILPPAYGDGYNSPRLNGISGRQLPNPRLISLAISTPSPVQRLENNITHLFPIFGQFITHDISGASAITDSFGNEIICPCGSNNKICMGVKWPVNDPYLNQSCMNFTRSSASFPDSTCTFTYREQLNLLSSFIDGNQIYGIDIERMKELREFKGGLLKTSSGILADKNGLTNRKYLPLANDTCSDTNNYKCFLAGEFRTSENLGLVSMHTLFNREHNRVATQLLTINPTWNDDQLFYEARRIVIAEIQHILYNEWLPIVSGDISLKPLNKSTYYTGYNSSINPALTNEFATAAFRMGHSLIRQKSSRYDVFHTLYKTKSFDFEKIVFNSDLAYDQQYQGLNSIFLGLIDDLCWKFGSFGFELQNRLFAITNGDYSSQIAVDLLATNINRGRDHGLQPYVYYVKKCLNKTINNFSDLEDLMNGQHISALQSLYESVNDIDLYAGGLSEFAQNVNLTVVGPTFSCIIMNQFKELKNGDRFYYENSPLITASAFKLTQLDEIKNLTMAGLICNNYDIFTIQKNPFFNVNSWNPMINCSTVLNQINLTKWKNG